MTKILFLGKKAKGSQTKSKIHRKPAKKNRKNSEISEEIRLTNASPISILTFVLKKKEFRAKRLCSISRHPETGNIIL